MTPTKQFLPEEELDLKVFARFFVLNWKTIVTCVVLSSLLGILYITYRKPFYATSILLRPAKKYSQGQSSPGNSLLNRLGGVASLMGVSLTTETSDVEANIMIMRSRSFARKFVYTYKLEKIFPIPPGHSKDNLPEFNYYYGQVVGFLKFENDKSGMTIMEYGNKDPNLSRQVLVQYVKYFNAYVRNEDGLQDRREIEYLTKELNQTSIEDLRSILFVLIAEKKKSIMLAQTNPDYAFRILDEDVVPGSKERKISVVLAVFVIAGFMFGSTLAFLLSQKERLIELARAEDK